MIESASSLRFRRYALLTLAAVYCVILAGGIVRASGAGMGCPDWPTCFGQWIPPTDESQLPANYHEIYAQRGYADTLFNPMKTWTEYVNRLIGATAGILVLLTVWAARPMRAADPTAFRLSAGVLLAIGFQGWLGKAVVASNLRPWMITAHMLMAFLIVCLLLTAIAHTLRDRVSVQDLARLPPRFKTVLAVALGMSVLQIAMGTQIRQSIDPLIAAQLVHDGGGDRSLWRESFPIVFYIHRSFSSILLATNLWLAWTVYRNLPRGSLTFRCAMILAGLIALAVVSGVSLDRLGFPAFVQPLHLLLANLIFGMQFFLTRIVRNAPQPEMPASGLDSPARG